jgi:hypothetical protein
MRDVTQEHGDRRRGRAVEVLHRQLEVLLRTVGRAHRDANLGAVAGGRADVGEDVDGLDDVVGVHDLEERAPDEGVFLVEQARAVTAGVHHDAFVIQERHGLGQIPQ